MPNVQGNRRPAGAIRSTLTVLASLAVVALAPVAASAEGWSVDAAHTEVNFSINHFFTPVTGSFSDFEIDLDYRPDDISASSVEATIQVASLDTGNERRDGHVASADFFNAEEHPTITFKSTSVAETEDGIVARGELTIKGQTQETELGIKILGVKEIPEEMREMFGGTQEVASFAASTAIDRNDFGVGVGNWAATLVIGGEVSIEILLEAHRK